MVNVKPNQQEGKLTMNFTKLREKIVGPEIILPTPFDSSYRPNYSAVKDNIEFMIEKGVTTGNATILVGGAVAQFHSMTIDERKKLAKAAAEAADDRVPIIFGAQHASTDLTIELSQYAVDMGIQVVQISPPYYYHNLAEDDLYNYFNDIAETLEIGISLYNTYYTTDSIGLKLLGKVVAIDNVIALKWSDPPNPGNHIMAYLQYADNVNFIDNAFNYTFTLSHQIGGKGFVSAIGAFWPEFDLKLWELMEAKKYEEAGKEIKKFVVPYYDFDNRVSGYGTATQLAALEIMGRPSGIPRRPTYPLSKEERKELKRLLKNAGAPVDQI